MSALLRTFRVMSDYVRRSRAEYYVFVLDEARGDDELKRFVDIAYNDVQILLDRGCKTTVLVITNYDAYVSVLQSTRKCIVYFMWNLDERSSAELCRNLGCDDERTCRAIYRLTSGNPREIVRIFREHALDVRQWALHKTYEVMSNAELRELVESRADEILEICEDVDELDRHGRCYYVLNKYNLAIRIPEASELYLSRERPPESEEIGVGERYAWQVSMYKHVVCNMARAARYGKRLNVQELAESAISWTTS